MAFLLLSPIRYYRSIINLRFDKIRGNDFRQTYKLHTHAKFMYVHTCVIKHSSCYCCGVHELKLYFLKIPRERYESSSTGYRAVHQKQTSKTK